MIRNYIALALVLLAPIVHAQDNFSKDPARIPQLNDPCAEALTDAGSEEFGLTRGHEIVYCSDQPQFDRAMAVKMQIAIDNVVLGVRGPDTCNSNGRAFIRCYLTATREMLVATSAPGRHLVILTPIDPTDGVTLRTPLGPLTLTTGCPALDLTVNPWRIKSTWVPVGTSFGQANQATFANFSTSLATAADAGYHTDWVPFYFAKSTLAADRFLTVVGRCYGVPQ